jgi:hypothetical protein
MVRSIVDRLQDFGSRSLLTHLIMAVTLGSAFAMALFVEGDVGLVSFVALLNFTAGMWVCQSIHAVGNPDYRGILNVVTSDGG